MDVEIGLAPKKHQAATCSCPKSTALIVNCITGILRPLIPQPYHRIDKGCPVRYCPTGGDVIAEQIVLLVGANKIRPISRLVQPT